MYDVRCTMDDVRWRMCDGRCTMDDVRCTMFLGVYNQQDGAYKGLFVIQDCS